MLISKGLSDDILVSVTTFRTYYMFILIIMSLNRVKKEVAGVRF